MASLWDLINGYSQGGAPSEGSTQTLGQAARDVYQGLINPKAWQEVQQATKRTQQVNPISFRIFSSWINSTSTRHSW